MSLRQLCDEIKRVHQEASCTPVLTVPKYLSLRNEFLVALCGQLVDDIAAVNDVEAQPAPGQPLVRMDWLRSGDRIWSTISDPWTRMRAAKISAALNDRHGMKVQVQVTSTIGRPLSAGETLVVGLCNTQSALPRWARKIHLLGSSTSSLSLQFS